MFIRVFRPSENKEMLFNVDHISKIEVEYAIPSDGGNCWSTSLDQGIKDTGTVRFYRVHVAGEAILLRSNSDDPVIKVIEDIYKAAIKG